MKPSERYQRDAEHMMLFRNAYVDLINHSRARDDGWSVATLGPGTDHHTWQAKLGAVAAAVGVAAVPYRRYGGVFTLRNAAYIMNNVDPVTNWEMSLRDPDQLSPQTIVGSVDSAIARARQLADEAVQRERGITGLIAAFLRWPSDLRDAVGTGHPAQRTAAGVIGVFGQILVTGIGGAVTIGVVAGIVAVWRTVF